ncbi:hypothetical protein HZS_21 [Henneguya salminicola]|nr:hypothetical protein HZS_21 [Henneguya salminicola]
MNSNIEPIVNSLFTEKYLRKRKTLCYRNNDSKRVEQFSDFENMISSNIDISEKSISMINKKINSIIDIEERIRNIEKESDKEWQIHINDLNRIRENSVNSISDFNISYVKAQITGTKRKLTFLSSNNVSKQIEDRKNELESLKTKIESKKIIYESMWKCYGFDEKTMQEICQDLTKI